MRKPSLLSVVVLAALGTAAPAAVRAAGILIDHTTTDASAIPSSDLDAARALTMSFSHASVGANMWGGLGLLKSDDAGRYSFPSWIDVDRGNPGWQAKIDGFETYVADHASVQVFLNKLCFIDQDASFTYYRDSMVGLAAAHPAKTLVWFTIPLEETGTSNSARATFNASVRAYASTHDIVLFDLADIESHTSGGTAVTSGGYESLAHEYSLDGGHLNDAGARRAAGAMWQLMARIAGGSPSGGPVCGNGRCEAGESATSCAADCSASDPGAGSASGSSGGCGFATRGDPGGAAALLAVLLPVLGIRRRRSTPGRR
jgi:MYXO-CTERM domain-containing protein